MPATVNTLLHLNNASHSLAQRGVLWSSERHRPSTVYHKSNACGAPVCRSRQSCPCCTRRQCSPPPCGRAAQTGCPAGALTRLSYAGVCSNVPCCSHCQVFRLSSLATQPGFTPRLVASCIMKGCKSKLCAPLLACCLHSEVPQQALHASNVPNYLSQCPSVRPRQLCALQCVGNPQHPRRASCTPSQHS